MDILNSYVHEGARYHRPVYVYEPMNANGKYTHGGTIGRRQRNLWGGKSYWYYYLDGLLQNLTKHIYRQSKADSCVVYKIDGND